MSGVDPAMVADWAAAVGRTETLTQRLEVESLRRYALAAGADPAVERAVPPLGHWAFFLPGPGDDRIGGDGHSQRGGFLPAITLPRRMFAASAIDFDAPLESGAPAEQASRIAAVTHKTGRTGDLVFVEVERTIVQSGTVRVRERQTYVYREVGEAIPAPVPVDGLAGEVWTPTAVNLFRFSAATFNGHRIHYDHPYATGVEGYPGLVVHGPLTAAKLAGLAMRDGDLSRFAFRAQAPLFLGQPIRLVRHAADEVRAIRCDGAVAMTATVAYR